MSTEGTVIGEKSSNFPLLFAMNGELLFLSDVKAVSANLLFSIDYGTLSHSQTVYIRWNYSFTPNYGCYAKIDGYISGTYDNTSTLSAAFTPETLSRRSYEKHQHRMREGITYLLSEMNSSYATIFNSYALNRFTGITASVNTDFRHTKRNSYLTLKRNLLVTSDPNINVLWRIQETRMGYALKAEINNSSAIYTDTATLQNKIYEFMINTVRTDNINIYNDRLDSVFSASKPTFSALSPNFKANGIDKKIYMSWSHTKDCDGYKIYQRVNSLAFFTRSLAAPLNKEPLSYDTTVVDYVTYSYRLAAHNINGDSAKLNKTYNNTTNRTMLPTRFLGENSRVNIKWDPETREVRVAYPGK